MKKKIIITFAIIIIVVIIYCIIWLIYYYSLIQPLISKAEGYKIQKNQNFTIRNDSFTNGDISGIITLTTPPFGKFAGNLSILQATLVDEDNNIINPYSIDLTISLNTNKDIKVTIYKTTSSKFANLNINAEDIFIVDKEMNIVNRQNHSSEAIALYETYKDVVIRLKEELINRFGEDLLD